MRSEKMSKRHKQETPLLHTYIRNIAIAQGTDTFCDYADAAAKY